MAHSSINSWFKLSLWLFLFSTAITAQSSSSSSCSTAQRLQAGVPSEGEITLDSPSFNFCTGGTGEFSESELEAGNWFSYATALTESRIVQIQIQCTTSGCDALAGEISPIIEIFEGSCDSLTCEDISALHAASIRSFQNELGAEYIIYVYTPFAVGGAPYVLSFDEIEPPPNDGMGDAIAFTSQDLPYQGDFSTYGARSDLDLDACGLEGAYGVWFTYQTTSSSEEIVLRATDSLGAMKSVGVQLASGDQFTCITYAFSSFFVESIEWIAESGMVYLILVAEISPDLGDTFALTVQSRGGSPVSPTTTVPASTAPPAQGTAQTSDAVHGNVGARLSHSSLLLPATWSLLFSVWGSFC